MYFSLFTLFDNVVPLYDAHGVGRITPTTAFSLSVAEYSITISVPTASVEIYSFLNATSNVQPPSHVSDSDTV